MSSDLIFSTAADMASGMIFTMKSDMVTNMTIKEILNKQPSTFSGFGDIDMFLSTKTSL